MSTQQQKHWRVAGFTVTESNEYWSRVCDERDVPMAYVRNREDAALMAAAPDMLAALEDLQESAIYWSEYDVPVGIVGKIKSAIAKAKGAE